MNWHDVGKLVNASEYIHPTGKDINEYLEQGMVEAYAFKDLAGIDNRFTNLLDYGCGDGRLLYWFNKFCYAKGYDVSLGMLERCWYRDLYAGTDIELGMYDIVHSYLVLMHLNNQERFNAMHSMRLALRDNGIAYMQLPIYKTYKEPEHFTDVGCETVESFHKLAKKAGLQVLEYYAHDYDLDLNNVGPNHFKYHKLKKCL